MGEKLLATNEAANYLGVTGKTLKEWDYNGYFKPTLYTEGGHRRYSMDDLNEFLYKGQEVKSSQSDIEKEILHTVALYAKGIINLTGILENQRKIDNKIELPGIWRKSSVLMLQLTERYGLDEFKFPLVINEQYELWKNPLNTWKIKYFNKIFRQISNEETVLYNIGITDYCRELADVVSGEPEEIDTFKTILEEIRKNAEYNEYTKIRRFIIENPVISNDDLEYHLLSSFSGSLRKYRQRIQMLYEDIPSEFAIEEDYFYKCPYCGWTLKRTLNVSKILNIGENNKYRCSTDKCKLHTNSWELGEKLLYKNYSRVKPGVQKYIVAPGKIELSIYRKLLALFDEKYNEEANDMIVLYPFGDSADIMITFKNGTKWVLDIKDWRTPQSLISKLNEEEMFSGLQTKDFDRGILVIPSDYGKDYTEYLKAKWNESEKYDVLNEKQLIHQVKEGLV